MAELDQISVDADGIPSAAGTDTVPTLAPIRDTLLLLTALIDTGALVVKLDPTTVNANSRAPEADSAPVAISDEDFAVLQAIETATEALGTGLTVFRSLDLDETEEDVKTSAGKLWKLRITNFATAPVYVKLYNATAANVTVGSTTPIDTIVVPAATASDATILTETFGGKGLTFSTALSIAATTALADADTGAPAANACVVSAYYE